jgi:hypothetical protein
MLTSTLGEVLCSFASQKNYLALYISAGDVVEAHRAELRKLNCGKRCIRFRKLDGLPLDVVAVILQEGASKR